MSDEKKLPKRRFKEFLNTPSWEQRKLGEVATFSKGNGYSKSDLVSDGQPIILYGRLYTNYETTINKVDTFVELKDNSVISQGGEVIVPASGETAEDISRAAVIENQGIIIGGDLNVIRVKELLNPTFLALTISNGEQQKELSKRAQGKSVVHLHNSDLQEVNLVFPTLNEQKEISSFFEKLDDAITLHQRKLNKLENLKKAYLEELFPDGKQCKPKRRFKEFKEDWEQRKLGEVAKVEMDKRIYKEQTTAEGEIPFYKIGTFGGKADSYISEELYNEYTQKYSHPKEGDILISASGSIGRTVVYHGEKAYFQDSNIVWLNHKGALDNGFLLQFYSRVQWAGLEGSTIKRLYNKNILETEINVPNIEEQKNIGKFFTQVDNLITLHQRKLKKLKNLKEAYLGELFV